MRVLARSGRPGADYVLIARASTARSPFSLILSGLGNGPSPGEPREESMIGRLAWLVGLVLRLLIRTYQYVFFANPGRKLQIPAYLLPICV